MLERLQEMVVSECGLRGGHAVLVGVSGGPDSLCLLDVLHRLGYPVIVAHFNHRLRPEAEVEAQAVQRVAGQYRAPFVAGAGDTGEFAEAHGLSIEEAGRSLRYTFLFEKAERAGAQAVAVGHTADDQVETVLMHLLRGAGLSGLKGMPARALPNPWSDAIPLVRPLLSTWRSEVLAYIKQRGLKPHFDASNLDTTYFRNRLRHELIPTLERYNPAARALIWRTARVLRDDYEVVEERVGAAWETVLAEAGASYLAFDLRAWLAEPLGVQRHLLRRAIAQLRPGLRDIGFDAVERALGFLGDPQRPEQIDLVAGLRLFYETVGDPPAGRFWLAEWEAELPPLEWPQAPQGAPAHLDVPGTMALPGGWQLRAERLTDLEGEWGRILSNDDPFQAWLSAQGLSEQILSGGLEVRARRPGDRFQPLGMGGRSVKLSDFMINVKMPRRARQAWPLVCAGGEVVWVPGYRLGHPFRLKEENGEAIYLRLSKEDEGLAAPSSRREP